MNPRLREMIIIVGMITVGGVTYQLATSHPSTRTMAELKDAGILDCQNSVIVRGEKLTQKARNRINAAQPGVLRPRQQYAQVARTQRCCSPDGVAVACFDAQGNPRPVTEGGIIIVASLKLEDAGVLLDDEDGESNEGDESQSTPGEQIIRCADFDAGDPSPFTTPFCSRLNRMMAVPPPCAMPNCWTLADGGWDDTAVVDCLSTVPDLSGDATPRWRGCNVIPGTHAVGAQCVPVNCAVQSGDSPPDFF